MQFERLGDEKSAFFSLVNSLPKFSLLREKIFLDFKCVGHLKWFLSLIQILHLSLTYHICIASPAQKSRQKFELLLLFLIL